MKYKCDKCSATFFKEEVVFTPFPNNFSIAFVPVRVYNVKSKKTYSVTTKEIKDGDCFLSCPKCGESHLFGFDVAAEETKTSIELSIDHWWQNYMILYFILHSDGIDWREGLGSFGYSDSSADCPCCLQYSRCAGCPIKKCGYHGCRGTPYDETPDSNYSNAVSESSLNDVLDEIEFLYYVKDEYEKTVL